MIWIALIVIGFWYIVYQGSIGQDNYSAFMCVVKMCVVKENRIVVATTKT